MLGIFSTFSTNNRINKMMRERIRTGVIGCIPSSWYDGYRIHGPTKSFIDMGFSNGFTTPIGRCYQEEAVDQMLEEADAIYLPGGNTFEFLGMLQYRNIIPKLKKFYERGGSFFGSSAGSILMGPSIAIASFADPNFLCLNDLNALGFVDFAIKPHWDGWAQHETMFRNFSDMTGTPLFGLREGQGIIVDEDGKRTYIGGKPKAFNAW